MNEICCERMTFKMTGAPPNAQNTNSAANQYLITFPVSSTCWSYVYYEAANSNGHFPTFQIKNSAISTGLSLYGVYCPGSAEVPSSSGPPNYYEPPFLRQCVAGYYCPTTTVQLPCQDIYFYPTGYGGYLGGNYVLQPACKTLPEYDDQCTSNLINGFPYYINYQSNLFLAYYPEVSRPLLFHNPLILILHYILAFKAGRLNMEMKFSRGD